MWRKLILIASLLIVLLASVFGWLVFGSNTNFTEKSKYLYLHTGRASFGSLMQSLEDSNYIRNPWLFEFVAGKMDLESYIRAGRYEIRKGMSIYNLARMLRNGRQAPVNLVITKLRTKESLASLAGRKLECDSASVMAYLNNEDSLRSFGLDTNTVMTVVFPNTYTYFWNSTASILFGKLDAEYTKVWTGERKAAAARQSITPAQAYILASIVEEETNANEEKGNIASVYLNRLKKGMRLQADPTVKFALRDFSLKRIYEKHLAIESPYNTYRVTGLPPGPICTPSLTTLDAVLHAPATDYLYFVAMSDFSGRHVFSATYEEHLKHAKEFQEALDKQEQIRKAAKEDIGTH